MTPKVFLYRHDDDGFKLYVGNISASSGLLVFPSNAPVSIENYGDTGSKGNEWISKSDLPSIETVDELRAFLKSDVCNFIDLEVRVGDFAKFSAYEDGECEYVFSSQSEVSETIARLSTPESTEPLTFAVLNNPNVYIELIGNGQVRRHATFDAYISASRI